MNRKYTYLFSVMLIGLLCACSPTENNQSEGKVADMEGIVLEIMEDSITLARNLTPEAYEKIKDQSVTKLHNEDVAGERESLGLIYLTYEHHIEFNKGDQVEVWIDGDIMESYPEKAKAKKIVLKQ